MTLIYIFCEFNTPPKYLLFVGMYNISWIIAKQRDLPHIINIIMYTVHNFVARLTFFIKTIRLNCFFFQRNNSCFNGFLSQF